MMRTTRRVAVALGAAIAVGALTVGSVGALPQARGAAGFGDRVKLTVENETQRPLQVQIVPFSVNCIPDFGQPIRLLPHERRNLDIELSSSFQCQTENKRAQWRAFEPAAGFGGPEYVQFSYERTARGQDRLECVSRKPLECFTSGSSTVRIQAR
jgi:hypothetical protein